MTLLSKKTQLNLESFRDAIIKNVLKECKEPIKFNKFDQDTIDIMLQNVGLKTYEINVVKSQDYQILIAFLDTLYERKIETEDLIKTINVGNIEENIMNYNQLYSKLKAMEVNPMIISTYLTDLSRSIPFITT